MYRKGERKYFEDHIYEPDHPKDIIHFIYDRASTDLQLDDHIEEVKWHRLHEPDFDIEMDM